MRFVPQEIKSGWIVYDTTLMRPVSTHVYGSRAAAELAAAKLN